MAVLKFFERIDSILTGIEEKVIFALLASMLVVVFMAVVNRFFFQWPMSWAEEVARYLMIWAAFIGASLGVKHSVHISVDALVHAIPATAQRKLELAVSVLGMSFCAWFSYIAIGFIGSLINTGQLSPALRIPIYLAYASVPCGFILMSVRYLIKTVYISLERKNSNNDDLFLSVGTREGDSFK